MNKQILPPATLLNFTYYTYGAWKKCFPNETYSSWKDSSCNGNVIKSIDNLLGQIPPKNHLLDTLTHVRVCVIDEEYFEWCEAFGKEINSESRLLYMAQMTDEKANYLFKKYQVNKVITLSTVPLLVVSEKTFNGKLNLEMSEETKRDLISYFEKIVGKGNVYIFPYYIKSQEMYNDSAKIYNAGLTYFREGHSVRLDVYKTQEFISEEVNTCILHIPVFLCETLNSPKISTEELFFKGDKCLPVRTPESIYFIDLSEIMDPECTYGGTFFPLTNIQKDFNQIDGGLVSPNLLGVSEIPQLEQDLGQELKQQMKKQKKKFLKW